MQAPLQQWIKPLFMNSQESHRHELDEIKDEEKRAALICPRSLFFSM
ncbi:MAG: hypothetical protein R2877_07440 [Bdellovibrionota bacterium]